MEGDSWIVLGARKPNLVLKLNLCYVFFWLFSSYQDKLFSRPRKKGVLHDNHLYHVSGVKEVGRIQNVGQFSSVQSLSCVWLFETPWTAACQASLSFTISQSLLKLMSIRSVMPLTISSSVSPSPPAFSLSQHKALFKWISSSQQVAKESELQLQHQSSQWIFRTDFL